MSRALILDDFKFLIRLVEGVLEVTALTALFWAVCCLQNAGQAVPARFGSEGLELLTVVYVGILVDVFWLCDCFSYGHNKLADMVVSQWIGLVIVDVLMYFVLCVASVRMVAVWPVAELLLLELAGSLACVYLFTALYHRLYVPQNMLLVYSNENALDLKFKMDSRKDKYAITEIISVDVPRQELYRAIGRHDAVIINDVAGIKRNDILKYCYEHQIRTYLVPKISDIIITASQNVTLFDVPLRLIKGHGLSLPQRFIKRLFDIVLCLIALVPASPFMLITALAIKLNDGGPVFYRQRRVTKDGQQFDILKFRSMVVDAEKGGYDLSMRAGERDPRITKVGRLIRATRIDELPQLLNILKGEMSIVGPRPERVENVEAYSWEMPEWHYREKVKAGLTGYAQVYGKYNTSAYDKLRLDLMYIENYSLMLDVKLIFMTVRILFSKEATEGFGSEEEIRRYRKGLIQKLTLVQPDETGERLEDALAYAKEI